MYSQSKLKFQKLKNLWKIKESESTKVNFSSSYHQKNESDYHEKENWDLIVFAESCSSHHKALSRETNETHTFYGRQRSTARLQSLDEDSIMSQGTSTMSPSSNQRMSISDTLSESDSYCSCCESSRQENSMQFTPQNDHVTFEQSQELYDENPYLTPADEITFINDVANNNKPPCLISSRAKRYGIKRKRINAQSNAKADNLDATYDNGEQKVMSNWMNGGSTLTSRKSYPRTRAQIQSSVLSACSSCSAEEINSDLSRCDSIHAFSTKPNENQRAFRSDDFLHGEVLGQGFFGKAIKVTHKETGEVMVVKVLNSIEPEMETSFLKEVKIMRKLFHRNVIHFIGVVYENKHLSIITEYVEGGALKDLLTNIEKKLTWQQRLLIARDISSGMVYLHSKDIIHRDLNSGNCFVKKDGTVVVADFGLARLQARSLSADRKKRYTVVGNPYCMAPEMLQGNEYDEKVDVFSFGIVLCEVIGRISADPDDLPRSNNFGLAVRDFYFKYSQSCPPFYFAIAVHAADLNPKNRPAFQQLAGWFEMQVVRSDLPQLPEPPNLHDMITEVYKKYSFPLPRNLYSPSTFCEETG